MLQVHSAEEISSVKDEEIRKDELDQWNKVTSLPALKQRQFLKRFGVLLFLFLGFDIRPRGTRSSWTEFLQELSS